MSIADQRHVSLQLKYKGNKASKILTGVEFRANNIDSLDNLEKNSIDFYASVKSLYLQDRQMKIKNIQRGNIQIIYNDDGDWEEIDTK